MIEVTQIQADRWSKHLSRKRSGGNGKPVSSKRELDIISLYKKSQSISQCARDVHMGRDRGKKILKSCGVLT